MPHSAADTLRAQFSSLTAFLIRCELTLDFVYTALSLNDALSAALSGHTIFTQTVRIAISRPFKVNWFEMKTMIINVRHYS
jgi:hypothetical protein